MVVQQGFLSEALQEGNEAGAMARRQADAVHEWVLRPVVRDPAAGGMVVEHFAKLDCGRRHNRAGRIGDRADDGPGALGLRRQACRDAEEHLAAEKNSVHGRFYSCSFVPIHSWPRMNTHEHA